MQDYLKSFIIGSSWIVFIFFFVPVSQFGDIKNFDYKRYTFIAPLFLGLLNTFGLFLQKNYNLNDFKRFLYTGLIGAILVSIVITLFKAYNFSTTERWIRQYINLQLIYFFTFSIVIRTLEYFF